MKHHFVEPRGLNLCPSTVIHLCFPTGWRSIHQVMILHLKIKHGAHSYSNGHFWRWHDKILIAHIVTNRGRTPNLPFSRSISNPTPTKIQTISRYFTNPKHISPQIKAHLAYDNCQSCQSKQKFNKPHLALDRKRQTLRNLPLNHFHCASTADDIKKLGENPYFIFTVLRIKEPDYLFLVLCRISSKHGH